jgi:hypothetical protein
MSTPKPAKTKETYTVKFSNKTGGAYADMKAVIESERENWNKRKGEKPCIGNDQKDPKQDSNKK